MNSSCYFDCLRLALFLVLFQTFLCLSCARADESYDDFVRAQRYIQNANYTQALVFLSKALTLEPKFIQARLAKAFVLGRINQEDAAIKEYDQIIAIAPINAYAFSNKGFLLMSLGDIQEALKCLNRALELDPEFSAALANRGELYLRMGNLDKVITDCNRALELDPVDADPYVTRAEAYVKLKKYKLAIIDFNKAIDLHPDPVHMFHKEGEAYYLRSRLYSQLGKLAKAENDLAMSQSLGFIPKK